MRSLLNTLLVFVCVGAVVIKCPSLFASGLVNVGSLRVERIMMAYGKPGQYPLSLEGMSSAPPDLQVNAVLKQAEEAYARALNLAPYNSPARWGLGRVQLIRGNRAMAAHVLVPSSFRVAGNPLLSLDLMTILGPTGDLRTLVDVYEQASPPRESIAPEIRDSLALAYLEQSDLLQAKNNTTGEEEALRKVIALRPGDLFAQYRLLQLKDKREEDTTEQLEAIQFFDNEGIDPANDRLLTYAARVVPDFLAEGIWDKQRTLYIISFLVYQRGYTQGVADTLKALTKIFPSDPDWIFYIGEMNHHQGEWETAQEAYRGTINLDPGYARAYLKLGELIETQCRQSTALSKKCLDKAIEWYLRYRELAPDSLIGLKRLANVCVIADCLANEYLMELEKKLANKIPNYVLGPAYSQVNGWTLLGYIVNEDRLIRGEPTDMWLYWSPPSQGALPPYDWGSWYNIGNQWVQALDDVQNLVLNGGFELGMKRALPFGFPGERHRFHAEARVIEGEVRGGWPTTVAVLRNVEMLSYTDMLPQPMFVSESFPVDDDGVYLEAAWIRTEPSESPEGGAFLGYHWLLDMDESIRPYSYVASGVRAFEWTYFAGIVKPLRGANSGEVWLVNIGYGGGAAFDNVMLVKIGVSRK